MHIDSFPKLAGTLAMAFAMGLLAPQISGGLVQAELTGLDELTKYEEQGIVCFEKALEEYHLSMNEVVNDYIDRLTTAEEPNVAFVEETACDDSNASTYCLAVALNAELTELELYLSRQKDKIELNCTEGEETGDTVKSLDEALDQALLNNMFFENEMAAAEDVVDLTLDVYNQLQIVWPLHRQLADSISLLEEYRDSLAELRNAVELYPSRFNDATTVQCK